MDNGMVCFVNNPGHMYGCSGGSDNGGSGFNDVRSGTRYESIGGDRAVNTRSGQSFDTPKRYNNDDENYGDN